jgi:hypothetical protein
MAYSIHIGPLKQAILHDKGAVTLPILTIEYNAVVEMPEFPVAIITPDDLSVLPICREGRGPEKKFRADGLIVTILTNDDVGGAFVAVSEIVINDVGQPYG